MMSEQQWQNDTDRGKSEVLGVSPANNRLIYGMTLED
jgi:hypothetical protein